MGGTSSEGAGETETLNEDLWHACAGPLVSLPSAGSLVVYFPQGHSEQVAASMPRNSGAQIPSYPNLPWKLVCLLHSVSLHADPETDDVFAQMTLQPLNSANDDGAATASDPGHKPERLETEFFCKTLTASDTSTHGGFSVPRRAAENVFPPLDYSAQPPAQELRARDLHGYVWTFRHIYRGQPKRHLLTTGWSTFVTGKRLVAGDSVLFIRNGKKEEELLLGIRRASRQPSNISSSGLSSESIQIGILAAAAQAYATRSRFTVFYNPRASPSPFVLPLAKYKKAIYSHYVNVGTRFRMELEAEDSGKTSHTGSVTGIGDLDPARWKNSRWRNLQVEWDEPAPGERRDRVSVWEIEPVQEPFVICSPPLLEMENLQTRAAAWLGHEISFNDSGSRHAVFPASPCPPKRMNMPNLSRSASRRRRSPENREPLHASPKPLEETFNQISHPPAPIVQPQHCGQGFTSNMGENQPSQNQLVYRSPFQNFQTQQELQILQTQDWEAQSQLPQKLSARQRPLVEEPAPPQTQRVLEHQKMVLEETQKLVRGPESHPQNPRHRLLLHPAELTRSVAAQQPTGGTVPGPGDGRISSILPDDAFCFAPPVPALSRSVSGYFEELAAAACRAQNFQDPEVMPKPPMPSMPKITQSQQHAYVNSMAQLDLPDSSSPEAMPSLSPADAQIYPLSPFGRERSDPGNSILFGVALDNLLGSPMLGDCSSGNEPGDRRLPSADLAGDFEAHQQEAGSAAFGRSLGTAVSEVTAFDSSSSIGGRAGALSSWTPPQPAPPRKRTYTKVYKRGAVGRSIDVGRYSGYDKLKRDLARMFGVEGQLEEDRQRRGWKLVYVDHENDVLLVGDDPWEEFVNCVRCIKILSPQEVEQMSLEGDLGAGVGAPACGAFGRSHCYRPGDPAAAFSSDETAG